MFDCHTHLLPGIDDGSQHIEMTQAIVTRQIGKGIHTIALTPHFYPNTHAESFIAKRHDARVALEAHREDVAPDVVYLEGAEVLLSVDTWKCERIPELTLEGTNYLLLEMPSIHWGDWVYNSVQDIITHHGVIPILAHVERYDEVAENPNRLLPFLELGCLMQINAYSLSPKSSKRKLAHKLMKHKMVHVLGSDVHRDTPFITVKDGYDLLAAKHGNKRVCALQEMSERILANEVVKPEGYTPFKKFFGWR